MRNGVQMNPMSSVEHAQIAPGMYPCTSSRAAPQTHSAVNRCCCFCVAITSLQGDRAPVSDLRPLFRMSGNQVESLQVVLMSIVSTK